MTYCENCGKQLVKGVKNCGYCGHPAPEVITSTPEESTWFKFETLIFFIVVVIIVFFIIRIFVFRDSILTIISTQSVTLFLVFIGLLGFYSGYGKKQQDEQKIWYNKGLKFSSLNEYEKALDAYNTALTFNDKNADVWNNKSYVLIKLGKYDDAIKACKIAVELAPNDPEIQDTLKEAYNAKNNQKCDHCSPPENHNCADTYTPDFILVTPQAPKPKRKKSLVNFHKRIKDIQTWKNFTILSILLIFISFIPIFFPSYQNKEFFQFFFEIGFICLVISYFIYAIIHSIMQNRILALFMVAVPLFAAFFSSTKTPYPTNILVYVLFLAGICAIISVIVLVIGEKIYWVVCKHLLKINSRNHWYSLPNTKYAILGMICVSFIIINFTSEAVA